MRAFRYENGAYRAQMSAHEGAVLALVVLELLERLGTGVEPVPGVAAPVGDGPVDPLPRLRHPAPPAPDDPVLRALAPDASLDDPEVAAEFRRLTQDDLIAAKVVRLRTLHEHLLASDVLALPDDEAWATAGALTDLRLALAQLLDLRTDDDALALDARFPTGSNSPLALAADVFGVLGWLQGTLIEAMADRREPGPARPVGGRG